MHSLQRCAHDILLSLQLLLLLLLASLLRQMPENIKKNKNLIFNI
jgi:hypothetical protein